MTTNFKEMYSEKLVSMKEAARVIQSGDRIVANPVTGYPSELSDAITDRYEELEDIRIVSLFALKPYPYLIKPEVAERIHYETMFMGPLERKFYPQRLFSVNSINFSDLTKHIKERVHPDVFMAQVAPMDDDGFFNMGNIGVAIGRESADAAKKIILQVNKEVIPVNNHLEKEKGCEFAIHISEVDYICEQDAPLLVIPETVPTDLENQIA